MDDSTHMRYEFLNIATAHCSEVPGVCVCEADAVL
jgi:hypothetical protein